MASHSVEGNVGGFNRQLAAIRHRVARIHHQVHDDLLDLNRVQHDALEVLTVHHAQVDIFADEARKHLIHILENGVQVQHLGLKNLLSAECQ